MVASVLERSVVLIGLLVNPARSARCFYPPSATDGGGIVPAEPPRDGGCSVRDCGGAGRVAILLVGLAGDEPNLLGEHVEAIAVNVARPLAADTFVVFEIAGCAPVAVDAQSSPCVPERHVAAVEATLRQHLGARLRAVGTVGPDAPSTVRLADETIRAKLAPPAAEGRSFRQFDRRGGGAIRQWHKLHEAWLLMEAAEGAQGMRYNTVIKLRFDLVPAGPWRLCAARDGLLRAAPAMLHAMSDKVFWGRRDVMRVCAHMVEAIPYFESAASMPNKSSEPGALGYAPRRGRPNAMERPVAVVPLLLSLLSLPPSAFADWANYQKIGVLNVPDMGAGGVLSAQRGAGSRQLGQAAAWQLANLKAALAAGIRWVDPLSESASPSGRGAERAELPALRHAFSGKKDYREGIFVTEKDFLHWMLLSNVTVSVRSIGHERSGCARTLPPRSHRRKSVPAPALQVCDLGAETSSVLNKHGEWERRPSMSGCVGLAAEWPPSVGTAGAGTRRTLAG